MHNPWMTCYGHQDNVAFSSRRRKELHQRWSSYGCEKIINHDLQSALKVAEKAKTGYGLAQKGPANALRFAVRFRKLEDLP